MLTKEEMHERMEKGWRAGAPFTICGNGSLPEHTKNIREWLPKKIEELDIATVCDAGHGDGQWQKDMDWPMPTSEEYIDIHLTNLTYGQHPVGVSAWDLFPRAEYVNQIDITTEALPECDAIICRMVLNHLVAVDNQGNRNEERITMALDLFRESAKYLFATQFDGKNLPQRSSQFSRLDLVPYLGDPLDRVQDGNEKECSLALWEL